MSALLDRFERLFTQVLAADGPSQELSEVNALTVTHLNCHLLAERLRHRPRTETTRRLLAEWQPLHGLLSDDVPEDGLWPQARYLAELGQQMLAAVRETDRDAGR